MTSLIHNGGGEEVAVAPGRILIGGEVINVRKGDSHAHVQRMVDEACRRAQLYGHFRVQNDTELEVIINLAQTEIR